MQILHGLQHPGRKATITTIAEKYYWPRMKTEINDFVAKCHDCNVVKITQTITPPMSHRPVPQKRFSDLFLDIVGPLPESNGMRYLLTIVDRTTRFVDALPLPEANAANCCEAFVQHWVSRFGLPAKATTDNGNTFVSQIWAKLHETLGTIVTYTPLYHPASLGALERQHKDIKDSLKAVLNHLGDNFGNSWYSALPWVLLGKRAQFQPDLGTCPAELVFGQTPLVPGQLAGSELQPDSDLANLLDNLRTKSARPPKQTAHHSTPNTHTPAHMERATHLYVKRGKVGPLGARYDGPFEIAERLGTSSVKLRVANYANGSPRFEVHHWQNCKIPPASVTVTATRPPLGRPKKKPVAADDQGAAPQHRPYNLRRRT